MLSRISQAADCALLRFILRASQHATGLNSRGRSGRSPQRHMDAGQAALGNEPSQMHRPILGSYYNGALWDFETHLKAPHVKSLRTRSMRLP
jgi:hypothetical protein